MISYLKGVLSGKEPVIAIIDCQGVGYEVNIPLSTFDKLPEIGKEVKLLIHYSFNEVDGNRLFGFITSEEKELFRHLIAISKIGPKLALSILSGLSVGNLIHAIQIGDVSLIATIPGIGKKSAERLIIELKDRVGSIQPDQLLNGGGIGHTDMIKEAESALLTLGYKQFEIRKIFSALLKEQEFTTSEEIVKACIKALYRKRS
jgi:Holliday junction DNA helicase RuvA